MSSNQNDAMNVVEVNLNNGRNNNQKINSNIDYHVINVDNDNSGNGSSNNQEDGDEEKEQEEELSMAEIEHLKKFMNRLCYVMRNMQNYILLKVHIKNQLPIKTLKTKLIFR